jgi:hypothetical protein
MGKVLALFLLTCWPALASLVPPAFSDSEIIATEDPLDWLFGHSSLVSPTQPQLVDGSALPGLKGNQLLDAGEIVLPVPPQSLDGYDSSQEPGGLSGGTNPPGKFAFFVIILSGAVIRFLTSATFRDFLVDVYSPLAPY